MADELMKTKWQIAFKLLDFNKDGVLSSADRDECKESFQKIYQPSGPGMNKMMSNLDDFWEKSLFLNNPVDWSKSLTLTDFMTSRRKLYNEDKAAIRDIVKAATIKLVEAADTDGKGKFSFEDFKKLHVAANQTDELFIKAMYDVIGYDADGVIASESIEEFYTELTMGSDVDKHAKYLAAFSAAGFL